MKLRGAVYLYSSPGEDMDRSLIIGGWQIRGGGHNLLP